MKALSLVKHLDNLKALFWKILPHFAFVVGSFPFFIGLFSFIVGLFSFVVGLFAFVSRKACFVFAARDFFVSQ